MPHSHTPIAVIGVSGRYPGARDLGEFWENVTAGVESFTHFSDEELREAGVPDSAIDDPAYRKVAPLLPESDLFDPGYFGMTAREAEVLDPQHRVFLEVCDRTLQDAGYDPHRFADRIGVFGGVGPNNYMDLHVRPNPEAQEVLGGLNAYIANLSDYVATGVSYRLNLRGPAMTCLTACSTSLVATHLAAQSIRAGECEMALAGGVEEFLPRIAGYHYAEGGMLSHDGHVRTFDSQARGTVFGSGAGAVLLKDLAAAERDGDRVLGVIRGSAINNDGDDKGGFTAPSASGQTRAIRDALAAADVDPRTISYVEAHGTGTFVGDPIEVGSLSAVYGEGSDETQWCGIGSVKPNVGHLGAAAGVVGMTKLLLSLKHQVIPPTINFEEPNPQIDFEASPFRLLLEPTPWTPAGQPRRAGLSSFGVGGTNAHIIIEEYVPQPVEPRESRPQLLTISARSADAYQRTVASLGAELTAHEDLSLEDAAYTLATGRPQLPVRGVLVAESTAEAAAQLTASVPHNPPAVSLPPGRSRSALFMFPGQGAQYPGMAADLYRTEEAFRRELDGCADLLRRERGWDLRELLFDGGDDAAERLSQTEITQPALFSVEYALAVQLREWGVEPAALVGHSIGEFTAAAIAGVFTRDDALSLVAERGALMQALPGGSMLAVHLTPEELEVYLGDSLSIAAVNAPDLTVVSGPDEAIATLEQVLSVQGVIGSRLRTSHAFHSAMMDPVVDTFQKRVADVEASAPSIPIMSNLTGTWLTDDQAISPEYWARHLREAVLFGAAAQALLKDRAYVALEVGPGQTLTGLARRALTPETGSLAVPTMRHPQQRQDDVTTLLGALGQAWQGGLEFDLGRLWAGGGARKVGLPPVALDRVRCYLDAEGPKSGADAVAEVTETGPYYVPAWVEQALDAPDGSDPDATVLLLVERGEVGAALADRLREKYGRVVVAESAQEFAQTGPDALEIRPTVVEDMSAALNAALSSSPERLVLVHGWLLDPAVGEDTLARTRHGLQMGMYSLLSMVHAVGRLVEAPSLEIVLLTSDQQAVSGEEQIEPTKAAVMGFVKLLPKELSDTTCRSIDVVSTVRPERVVDHLVREIVASSDEEQVAYRGRKRWVWRHQEVDLPSTGAQDRLLPDGASVLITGGFGAIGLITARDLISRHQARVTLVGRSPLPDRDTWDQVLADESEDTSTIRERIQAVRELETLGGEVLVCTGDVTDVADMTRVRAEAEERFGRVDVVIHAAGVTGGGMLEARSEEDARKVVEPKIIGALVLDEVFGADPDLLLLYSTFAVHTGDFGLGDYASANAMMDAVAHQRTQRGDKITVSTVNWAIWRGIGMADNVDAPDFFLDFEVGARYEPAAHVMLDSRLDREGEAGATFVRTLSTEDWWVDHHRLGGRPTMPGVTLIESMRAAFEEVSGAASIELRDVVFPRPLIYDKPHTIHVELQPTENGWYAARVVDAVALAPGEPVHEYASARVGPAPDKPPTVHDVAGWRTRCTQAQDVSRDADENGVELVGALGLGKHWDVLHGVWTGEAAPDGTFDELVEIRLPEDYEHETDDFVLHPSMFDTATAIGQTLIRESGTSLPFEYQSIVVRGRLPKHVLSHISHLDDATGTLTRTDILVTDTDGRELVDIHGFSLLATDMVPEDAPTATDTDSADAAGGSGGDLTQAQALELALVRGENLREFGIEQEQGYEFLMRIIDAGAPTQVIVCPDSLTRRMAYAKDVTRDALREQLAAAPQVSSSVSERNLLTPYAAPETEVEKALATMWSETLAVDRVGLDDDFFELNGNSLIAVQMVARIRDQFRVNLTVASLFESRTVRALATVIDDLLIELVESMSEESAQTELRSSAGS